MPERRDRVFLTGGTGFLGSALIETNPGMDVVVLTRDIASFRAREPDLAASVELVEGDVRSFPFPSGDFTYLIHAAADTRLHASADAIVEGCRHVLDFAVRRNVERILYLSSGAVYGPDCRDHRETDPTRPTTPYGHAKLAAEQACLDSGIACVIARCFAFIGPRMPLDGSFAAGNFIRDAVAGQDVIVKGDGTDVRSYMDSGDCADWLWTILRRGTPGAAYNVGSDIPITIAELAAKVAAAAPAPVGVKILGQAAAGVSRRYVPSIHKAMNELGLHVRYPVEFAISRAMQFQSSRLSR